MRLTRREVLKGGAAVGGGMASGLLSPSVMRALAAPTTPGTLNDIEHVVIFINENRSFDHYFGKYPAVRGFSDPHAIPGVFAQDDPANTTVAPVGKLLPFHLDMHNNAAFAECTHDISHEWVAQHHYWNGGAMDKWVSEHNAADGVNHGYLTMGYYERADLDYYWALADAFTLCDSYYCSVLGPTDPNRLYSMTAWLDPTGTQGGPSTTTLVSNRNSKLEAYTWDTYPEKLQAKGVSWKIYQTSDGLVGDNVLAYFKNYGFNHPNASNPLWVNAFSSQAFPADFQADCAAGTLPQVSWVLCSLVQSEHPPAPPPAGENALKTVVDALTSSPLWSRSALFYTYDENGGFFDHVAPPVAPPGTAGEFLSGAGLAAGGGVAGPIGLGFRVPMIVVSPFSRGGFVASSDPTGPDPAHTYDHTSLLRFLETRFGAEVPNLSAWRRGATGDLTNVFNFIAPDNSVPSLPAAPLVDPALVSNECPVNATTLLADEAQDTGGTTVPFPTTQAQPQQDEGSRPAPSGPGQPASVPESPLGALELAAGAAAVAGAWLLSRRRRDDTEATG